MDILVLNRNNCIYLTVETIARLVCEQIISNPYINEITYKVGVCK